MYIYIFKVLFIWLYVHISMYNPLCRERNGNPLQYSFLENPRDSGAWWAVVHGVAQSQTPLKWLSSSSSNPLCNNVSLGFSGSSDGKESSCNMGRPGFYPGLGRSLETEWLPTPVSLAWRSPWTEDPGGLQSMGLQRVGHDWVHSTAASGRTVGSIMSLGGHEMTPWGLD